MIEVYFVRHGQSESNAGLVSAAPHSIPLTELGRRQAGHAAQALPEPARVVLSPFLRAQQTGQALLARFPGAAVEEWPVHEFTYLSPARYQNTSQAERRPHVQAYWQRADPGLVEGEGAESFSAFDARVRQTLARLRALPGGPVVVFGHGQFMQRVMHLLLTGQGVESAQEMTRFRSFMLSVPVANAALLPLRLAPSGAGDAVGTLAIQHIPGELVSY